jgi:hypothetical protein
VAADGAKLPLMFIAEGKMRIVEGNQIGVMGKHWRFQTGNRWQIRRSFTHDLRLLRGHIGGGEYSTDRIDVITDLHKAHMTQAVRQTAEELRVERGRLCLVRKYVTKVRYIVLCRSAQERGILQSGI